MQPEKPVNVWFRREYVVGGQRCTYPWEIQLPTGPKAWEYRGGGGLLLN